MVIKKFDSPVAFKPAQMRRDRAERQRIERQNRLIRLSKRVIDEKLTPSQIPVSQFQALDPSVQKAAYQNDYNRILRTNPSNTSAIEKAREKLGLKGRVRYSRRRGPYLRSTRITGLGKGYYVYTNLRSGKVSTGGIKTTKDGKRVTLPTGKITITPQARYVDKFGVVRKEGQTGFNVGDYLFAKRRGVKSKGKLTLKGVKRELPSDKLKKVRRKISKGGKLTFRETETLLTQGAGGGIELNKNALSLLRQIAERNKATTSFITNEQLEKVLQRSTISDKQLKEFQEKIVTKQFKDMTAREKLFLKVKGSTKTIKSGAKLDLNKEGKVIGVTDPYSKSSFRLDVPVKKEVVANYYNALSSNIKNLDSLIRSQKWTRGLSQREVNNYLKKLDIDEKRKIVNQYNKFWRQGKNKIKAYTSTFKNKVPVLPQRATFRNLGGIIKNTIDYGLFAGQQIYNSAQTKRTKSVLKNALIPFLVAGKIGSSAIFNPFKHYVKDMFSGLLIIVSQSPRKTGKQIKTAFQSNPVSFISSFILESFLLGSVLRGGAKVGKVTGGAVYSKLAKSSLAVKSIPSVAKGYRAGTILKSGKNLAIVGKGGKTIKITQSLISKAIEKSLESLVNIDDILISSALKVSRKAGNIIKNSISKLGFLPKSKGLRFKTYLKRISDPILRRAVEQINIAGNILQKKLGNIRVRNPDFSVLYKDRNVINALRKTHKELKVRGYGSFWEYEMKRKFWQNWYKKYEGKSYTLDQAIERLKRDAKKWGASADDIERLIGKPKDYDLAVDDLFIKKYVKNFDKKYRYINPYLESLFKGTKFDMKIIRKDKSSVLSKLSKKQIDDIFRGFTSDKEVAVFKLLFMENLYKTSFPKNKLRKFDLSSGIELKGTDFAIDLHGVKGTGLTKAKLFGLIQKKSSIPLETLKNKNFKKVLFDTEATLKLVESQLDKSMLKVANKVKKRLAKVGIRIDAKKFAKKYPKFLKKAEIINYEGFDFSQTKKPKPVNKKVLRSWKEAVDFFNSVSPQGLAKVSQLRKIVGGRIILDELLRNAKRTSKKYVKLQGVIDELTAIKETLLYTSTGNKKALKEALKFNKKIKLVDKLKESDQKKLLEFFKNWEGELSKRFTRNKIADFINYKTSKKKISTKEIDLYDTANKKFIDLDKGVERKLEVIRKFKTKRFRKTKDGLFYVNPLEQLRRRTAGAIAGTLIDSRRAKDLRKLYDQIKNLELSKRKQLALRTKTNPSKFKQILDKVTGINRRLKRKIDMLDKLGKELSKESLRKKRVISTKGASETIGFTEINFKELKRVSPKANSQIRKLGFTKKEKALVKKRVKNYLDGKSQKNTLQGNVDRLVNQRLVKYYKRKARRKSVPRKLIKSKVPSVSRYLIYSTIRSLTRSGSKSVSSSISKFKSVSKSVSRSKSKSKSKSRSMSKSKSRSRSKSKSRSRSKSKSKSTSRSKSKSTSKSKSKSGSKSGSSSRSKSRSRSRVPPPPVLKTKLTWDTKLPRGYSFIVNPIVRIKGKNRVIKWKTTPNRAKKRMGKLVDNTTARSFALKIIGIKKVKDIRGNYLKKFRAKISKGSGVLPIVEKTKYAIDTKGEKTGLKLSRLLKKRRSSKKKVKVKKRRKKKKSNGKTKSSKRKRRSRRTKR